MLVLTPAETLSVRSRDPRRVRAARPAAGVSEDSRGSLPIRSMRATACQPPSTKPQGALWSSLQESRSPQTVPGRGGQSGSIITRLSHPAEWCLRNACWLRTEDLRGLLRDCTAQLQGRQGVLTQLAAGFLG